MIVWVGLFMNQASVGIQNDNSVKLLLSDDSSFVLQSGDFNLSYGQSDTDPDWVFIRNIKYPKYSIGTKLVDGLDFNPTERDALKSIRYAKDENQIRIELVSQRYWGIFQTEIIAYKKYPGLVHWKVTVDIKQEKVIHGDRWGLGDVDCHFFTGNATTSHQVIRYMVPRGPVTGMLYFYDKNMDGTVFYFQDYSSLNSFYDSTGCSNPFDQDREMAPSAVKMGYPPDEFQRADDKKGNISLPPKPWTNSFKSYMKFGYERPKTYRLNANQNMILADTYVYLKPGQKITPAEFCKQFCQQLSVVYQYIQKPSMKSTNWSKDIAAPMTEEILTTKVYWTEKNRLKFPRAYVNFKVDDAQLITLLDLLNPLVDYVKYFPEDKHALELKTILEKGLLSFWDDKWKGFGNNFEVPPNHFYSSWYLMFNVVNVADLALAGNVDAKKMLLGFRPRLLEMGKGSNYQFANVNTSTYQQSGIYDFEVTGEYLYVMMALYELSGKQDKQVLLSAKAAADKIAERSFDYTYELNGVVCGAVGCYQLYQATGETKYRDIAYIPLANAFRWAWLWECDYGVGKYVQTFWGFSPTPGNQNQAEHESHHARRFLRQYFKLAKQDLAPELSQLIQDSWIYGQGQSRYTHPPILVEEGAGWSMIPEGPSPENCGEVIYSSWVPLEDTHIGWCTDDKWYKPNPKNGVVGQAIYAAGGPYWYANWQKEDENQNR
jgi:hypothetical protein